MNPAETLNPATANLPNVARGSTESRPTAAAPLKPGWIVLLAGLAIAAFHLGFLFAPVCWLVLVWLGCLFALRRVPSGRWAFYTGLAIGLGIYGPQLYFFWNIFRPAAIALWLVLAFWIALFLLLLHRVERCWGTTWAVALAPVLWLGIEFFRSELYYLRFAWLTAGSFIPPAAWRWGYSRLGVYGIGAVSVSIAGCATGFAERCRSGFRLSRSMVNWALLGGGLAICVLGIPLLEDIARDYSYSGPTFHIRLTGIQLEFPPHSEVMSQLDRALREYPDTDVMMLGEYTFDGPVPPEVRDWCRRNKRRLIAGGKESLPDGRFYNTAYVISPEGEVVFKQAKAVPIQFFNDGLPAPGEYLWRPGMLATFDPQEPTAPPKYTWLPDEAQGLPVRVGLCICYDLSYALVVQRIIEQGERSVPLLLVPAMDVQDWGGYQHRIDARMTAIRAAEYRLWIFRVATSGISQCVSPYGRVVAETSYPGQGEILSTEINSHYWRNRIPADRVYGFAAVVATLGIMTALVWLEWRSHYRVPSRS